MLHFATPVSNTPSREKRICGAAYIESFLDSAQRPREAKQNIALL